MRDFRIALRPVRFELGVLVLLGLAALALAIGVIVRLSALDVAPICFGSVDLSDCPTAAQLQEYQRFAGTFLPVAMIAVGVAPAVAALVVGVSMVGKEIDARTTLLSWSLSASRRRWLALRVAPVGLALLVLGLVGGVLADRLAAFAYPGVDPAGNLAWLGFRGAAPATEALAVFGISLLVGAVIGRLMPSLLLSAVVAVAAYGGGAALNEAVLMGETIVVGSAYDLRGAIAREALVQTPDGRFLTWDEALARFGEEAVQLPQVQRVNPGEIVGPVTIRLALLYLSVGLACIALAFATVDRRRP